MVTAFLWKKEEEKGEERRALGGFYMSDYIKCIFI